MVSPVFIRESPCWRRLAVAVAFCLLASQAAQAAPSQVILIRHGEKPSDGDEPRMQGALPTGKDDLSLKGWERAYALAPYFLGMLKEAPVAIYAQKPGQEHRKSRRPVQTVQQIAGHFKLEVNQRFQHDDGADMAKEILSNPSYDGKVVLICWEHHVIPDIAKALGVKDPPAFPEVFDRTWVIAFENGKAELRDLPQMLMRGDSSD